MQATESGGEVARHRRAAEKLPQVVRNIASLEQR